MLIFRIDRPPPKRGSLLWSFAYVAHWCNIVQVHRFDPSPQHRLHLGPPLANKALTWAQLGPTWPNMVQLGPNLGLFGSNFSPSLSSTLLLTQRTLPAQSEILKTRPFTGVSHAFLCRSMRSPCWAQLCEAVAKGSQVEPC